MALTYRSPIEDIVGSFDTSHQAAIATTAATSYKELEADNFQYFNFALSPEGKKQLINAGVYLSPYSAVPHSHPCCKTLENYLLYKVLPSYIDNSFFFVGIKNFKLSILKKREKHLDMVKAINRYVTSADRLRYTSDFVVRASKSHKALERHGTSINSAPLRDLVPELMRYSARKLFLHDELHYWSPQDLGSFLDAVEPETVLGTLVYPPELLVGSPSSLNPWCYKYECDEGLLRFYPDGVLTEGYEQPVSGGFLLRSNTFTTLRGDVYCIDILCSKFAHHLVALTRGPAVTVTQRSFGPFQATDMQGLNMLTPRYRTFYPIQVEVVSRMYRYLRSLKKPDPQSAMAKLSQIVPEPTGAEIKFIQEFCEIVLQCNPISTMIAPDYMKTFTGNVLGCLPGVLAQRFKSVKEVCLDTFVGELKPFTAKIKLSNMNALSHFEVAILHEVGTSYDATLIEEMDKKFTGAPAVPERVAQLYAGKPGVHGDSVTWGTMHEHIADGRKIAYALQKVVMQSHLNKEQGICDVSALTAKLEFICRGSAIAQSMLMATNWRYTSTENIANIVKAVEKRASLCVVLYTVLGCKWFNHPRRGNLKYITMYNEGVHEAEWKPTFNVLIAQRCQERKWSNFIRPEKSERVVNSVNVPMLMGGTKVQEGLQNSAEYQLDDAIEVTNELNCSTSDDFGVTVEFPDEEQSDDGSVTIEFLGGTYTRGLEMPVMAYVTKDVPADGDCFWHCVCDALEINPNEAKRICRNVDLGSPDMNARLQEQLRDGNWAEDESIMACAKQLHLQIEIYEPDGGLKHVCKSKQVTQIVMLTLQHEHFRILLPRNGCMLYATARALNRTLGEVLKVIHENVDEELVLEIWEGEGLNHLHLETVFKLFDIQAHVEEEGHPTLFNEEGRLKRDFRMYDGHIEFTRRQGLAPTALLNKATYSRTINSKALEIMNRAGTILEYRCEVSRAKNLADSLYEGSTGVISSKLFNSKVHLLQDVQLQTSTTMQCTVILGTFGAGKSTLFKNFMKVNLGKCVTYVSPRKALAASFKADVFKGKKPKAGQEHWRVCTFEKFLMQTKSLLTGQAVIIDEVQLYPPGYLDLMGLLMPQGVHCFLVGDPCQSDYDSEQDRGRFMTILLFATKQINSSIDPYYAACIPKTCGALTIKFPFYIFGEHDFYCGLEAYTVVCNNNQPALSMLDGGDRYIAHDISYKNHTVRVSNDEFSKNQTKHCIDQIQTYNVHDDFDVINEVEQIYLFYHCLSNSSQHRIGCTYGNETTSVLAVKQNEFPFFYPNDACGSKTRVEVEKGDEKSSALEMLRRGVLLKWKAFNCSDCEASGGRCVYDKINYRTQCYCPDGPRERCNTGPPFVSGHHRLKLGSVLGILAAVIGVIVTIIFLMIRFYWKKSLLFWMAGKKSQKTLETFLRNCGPLQVKRYTYFQIKRMTENFKDNLGQGGYGVVYKGKLIDGKLVAVKLLKELKGNGEEFINEVASIGRTSHVNIVNLVGFCIEGSKRALIYEFMPNGSLEKFICGKGINGTEHRLEWDTMYKIALGTAQGLDYLHKGCNTRILHFDIKPHNILLDEEFNPKISDFGLAKICPSKQSIISVTGFRGTMGYIAPEFVFRKFGGVSHKSDVYSYGMLVLEMVGERRNVDVGVQYTSEIYFSDRIYKYLEQEEEIDVLQGIVNDEDREYAKKLLIVSMWCIQTNPSSRPPIGEIVEMLKGSVESLQIPPKPSLFSSPSMSEVSVSSTRSAL